MKIGDKVIYVGDRFPEHNNTVCEIAGSIGDCLMLKDVETGTTLIDGLGIMQTGYFIADPTEIEEVGND